MSDVEKTGGKISGPALLLRLEGLLLFVGMTGGFYILGGRWLWYGLLLLAPDVSMLGYLVGKRVGAVVYNVFHSIAIPAALCGGGLFLGMDRVVWVGLIWLAHIGIDRALGFGFKYQTAFGDTHFQRL